MINFEAELEKFQPSLDVEQAEEAIYNNNMTDITDVLHDFLNGEKAAQNTNDAKGWVEES